jgi:hypothetical protein
MNRGKSAWCRIAVDRVVASATEKESIGGIKKATLAIAGPSESWQQDMVHAVIPLISWPQFISCDDCSVA